MGGSDDFRMSDRFQDHKVAVSLLYQYPAKDRGSTLWQQPTFGGRVGEMILSCHWGGVRPKFRLATGKIPKGI